VYALIADTTERKSEEKRRSIISVALLLEYLEVWMKGIVEEPELSYT
jgi:hypothetical protein